MIRCALGFVAWSMLECMTRKCIRSNIAWSLAEAWQEHKSTSLAGFCCGLMITACLLSERVVFSFSYDLIVVLIDPCHPRLGSEICHIPKYISFGNFSCKEVRRSPLGKTYIDVAPISSMLRCSS